MQFLYVTFILSLENVNFAALFLFHISFTSHFSLFNDFIFQVYSIIKLLNIHLFLHNITLYLIYIT